MSNKKFTGFYDNEGNRICDGDALLGNENIMLEVFFTNDLPMMLNLKKGSCPTPLTKNKIEKFNLIKVGTVNP